MNFEVDTGKLIGMSLHAVFGTTKGRIGIIVAILIGVGGVFVRTLINSRSDQIARMMHARDIESAQSIGTVAMLAIFVLALFVCVKTWQTCNEAIGTRLKQTLQVDGNSMLYTYKPYGHLNPQARMIVLIDMNGASLSYDEAFGVLTVRGNVRAQFCRDISTEWPQSSSGMTEIDSFQIPNCFKPDLYHSLQEILG